MLRKKNIYFSIFVHFRKKIHIYIYIGTIQSVHAWFLFIVHSPYIGQGSRLENKNIKKDMEYNMMGGQCYV